METTQEKKSGICMVWDAQANTLAVIRTEEGEAGFQKFMANYLSTLTTGENLPMRTMLYFNQPEIVQSMPELEPEAIKDYLINKAPFMDREGMLPVYSLSGANALYCVQNDIPLLSVDANDMLLSLRPGYKNEIAQIEKSVPDLSERLARLQAGYQYPDMKPVDFYLLAEEHNYFRAYGSGNGDGGFRNFMLDQLATTYEPNRPLPEAVFIHHEMCGSGNIPRFEKRELDKYLVIRFGTIVCRNESPDIKTVSLKDAIYCVANDIPLLSKEADNISEHPFYKMDSLLTSMSMPDISEKIAKLRKDTVPRHVPSIKPPQKGKEIKR